MNMATIQQSIEVNVPLRTAYNQWTQFEEFPRFMEGVREVRQLDDAHLHWLAERDGRQIEWDSEITDQVPDQRIAWRDIGGSQNAPHNSGYVYFEPMLPVNSRVRMTMEYQPHAPASDPKTAQRAVTQRIEQDLVRFKQLLEKQGSASGAWRGEFHHGQSSGDLAGNPSAPGMERGSAAGKTIGQTASVRQESAQSAYSPAGSTNEPGPGATAEAAGGASASWRQQEQPEQPGSGRGRGAHAGAAGTGSQQSEKQNEKQNGPQSWLPNLLQGWDEPMVMVRKMSEDLDQLFERFIGRPMASRMGQGGAPGKWKPPVEKSQRDNPLIINTDLPGIKREDVQKKNKHNKQNNKSKQREESVQITPQGYRRSERSYGQFYRMIPLPEGVDPDSARATMRDGVLEISVPVPEAAARRGRKLDINTPDAPNAFKASNASNASDRPQP